MAALMTKAATETGATPEGETETEIQGLETEIKNLELNKHGYKLGKISI
jgi:hypothetical protein